MLYSFQAGVQDSLAEWSKTLASGASPSGRGFEPHSCHFGNTILLNCQVPSRLQQDRILGRNWC